MSLLDIMRTGVAIANRITKPLQSRVTFEKYLGSDQYGKRTFAAPVTLKAIVDWKQHQVRTIAGTLSVSRAYVGVLDVAALRAATRGDGIEGDDRFTLADGTTGPILDLSGFIDPETTHPFNTEIWLG